MRRTTLRFTAACVAWAAMAAHASSAPYPFRVDARQNGREYALIAANDGPATVTVAVQVSGENLASDAPLPTTLAISPYSSRQVARIHAADLGRSFSFTTRYSHIPGDATRGHDPSATYRLPYADGLRFRVDQAYGGEITTHNEPENRYAIDFGMPEGTSIAAARPGTVIEVVDHYSIGGKDPSLLDKANLVAIQHTDGTVGKYVHIRQGGALVKRGQSVRAGDLIAHSGNTGWSSGPHLHFVVHRPVVRPDGIVASESVPVTFQAFNPPVRFAAEQYMELAADYSQPGTPSKAPASQPRAFATPIQVPVPPKSPPAEEVLFTISREVTAHVPDWIGKMERASGYPWQVLLLFAVCGLVAVRLVSMLRRTTIAERREPTLAPTERQKPDELVDRMRSKR